MVSTVGHRNNHHQIKPDELDETRDDEKKKETIIGQNWRALSKRVHPSPLFQMRKLSRQAFFSSRPTTNGIVSARTQDTYATPRSVPEGSDTRRSCIIGCVHNHKSPASIPPATYLRCPQNARHFGTRVI